MNESLRFGAGLVCAALIPLLGFACSSESTGSGTGTGGAPAGGAGGAPASGGAIAAGGSMAGAMSGGGAAGANTGGATASSGGASGAAGVGGAAGAPDDGKALYVCGARPPQDPGGTGMQGAMCCGGKGTCVAPTGSQSTNLGHDTCATTLKCAPSDATMTAQGAFAKCTTKVVTSDPAGLEGRCIPKCFVLGNLQLPSLDNGGTCASGEICAPCFSPIDGKSTGACSMKTGDMPMNTTAPKPYVVCPMDGTGGMGGAAGGGGTAGSAGAAGSAGTGGTTSAAGSAGAGGSTGGTTAAGGAAGATGSAGMGGAPIPQGGGLCVPETTLAPLADMANTYYNPSIPGLKRDNCQTGEKCVPKEKVIDPGHCFDKCTTSMLTVSIGGEQNYSFGACTPAYVIYDVAGGSGITVSTGGGPCPADMLCAPCRDPLKQGAPSGSCY